MILRAPCTVATFGYKGKAPSDERRLRGKVFFTLMSWKYLQGKLGHSASGAGMSPNTWKLVIILPLLVPWSQSQRFFLNNINDVSKYPTSEYLELLCVIQKGLLTSKKMRLLNVSTPNISTL